MSTQYQVYRSLDAVPLNSRQWDAIAKQSGTSGIFLRKSWIEGWWNHLRGDSSLLFVAAEEKSVVTAFAPLMIDATGTLRFIGDTSSDYLGFAIPKKRPDLLLGIMRFLASKEPDWQIMHLRNVPRDSLLGKHVLDVCNHVNLSGWRNYSVGSPYLDLAASERSGASILRKYSIRRAERQLAKRGQLRYVVFRDARDAAPHWATFSAQHIERCRAANRPSVFSDPHYLTFLRSAFESPSNSNYVHFSAVLLDDVPIAYHFGFVSNNRLLWYKPSFDSHIRKASPGLVLIKFLISYALDSGLDELDFTIGDEPFKDRFCNKRRNVDHYRIHRSSTNAFLEKAYWQARRYVKEKLG